jgi:transposase
MTKALSVDLRYRVVEAVKAGSSCRAAAVRFGVSASSAILWVARDRERGDLAPCKRGGNQRSHRIDAQRGLILAWIEELPTLTLAEVAERLDEATGLLASAQHRVLVFPVPRRNAKKNGARFRAGPTGRSAPTSNLIRGPARSRSLASGLHRRKRDIYQDGRPVRPHTHGRALPRRRTARTLEDNDARRGAPIVRRQRADDARRAHERYRVPCLCRAGPRSDPSAWRHRRGGQSAGP